MTKKNYLKLFNYFFFVFVVMLISTFVFLTIDFSANSYSTWIDKGNYYPYLLKGKGTYSSPYLVSSAEELASVAYFVNNNSSTYKNKYFELTQNIDLSKHKWIPIGTKSYPFTGNFNGNKYVVSHMDIFLKDHYAGLFGYSTGQISNLMVSGTINGSTAYNSVGGIVGYSTEQIKYVSSNVKINCPKSNYVGGIVGYSASDIISAYNLAVITGNDYVGGIAGKCRSISLTYNSASSTIKGNDYVAGIVGECQDSLSYVYNLATINGNDCVAGIVGCSIGEEKELNDCFNKGNVAGMNSVAGIVGRCESGSSVNQASNSGEISGNAFVGGISGWSFGNFTKCYNKGRINGSSSEIGGIAGFNAGNLDFCRNEGAVLGALAVGGIVGFNGYEGKFFIRSCSNSGAVSGGRYIGGICGETCNVDVDSCFNNGTIRGTELTDYSQYIGGIIGAKSAVGGDGGVTAYCYNAGKIYVGQVGCGGGIVGYQYYGGDKIYNCYNIGKVNSVAKKPQYTGAICGRNEHNRGSVNNNYFLTGSCSPNRALGTSNGSGTNSSGGKSYEVSASELGNNEMLKKLSESYFKKGNPYPILIRVENEFYDIEDSFKERPYWWDTDSAYNNGHPILVNNYWLFN